MKKGTEEKDGKEEGKKVNETKHDRAEEGECMRRYEVAHQEIAKGMERKKQGETLEVYEVVNQSVKEDKTIARI